MTVKYRPDIDGLRALAVFPVIFFHAGHPWFTGGFLGVDVFFVISGFLITSFIVTSLQDGRFSFIDFYDRRARRILPALLLVMIVTTSLSGFFMLPNDLKSYGQSIVATVFSANNILLYLTSGYWSLAAEFKPLYHTWSLGVEEQFYLIAPLLLALVYRISRSLAGIAVVILAGGVASYYASLTSTNTEFNFLIIFTRAWELVVGSTAALLALRRGISNNNLLSLTGLGLVMFSYVQPYALSTSQAIVNLPAVLGTCLIILNTAQPTNPVHQLLTRKSLVFLGLLSYGIYLWHQPILAFIRLSSEYPPSYWLLATCGLLSVPLSWLSWKYVERPFRDRSQTSARRAYTPLLLASVALVGVGYYFHASYGLEQQRQGFSYGGDPRSYVDRVYTLQKPGFSAEGKTHVLVIGNSFARDFVNILLESDSYAANRLEVVYRFINCQQALDSEAALIGESELVVLASDWGQKGYDAKEVEQLAACHAALSTLTRGAVYVLGTKNFGWNNNYVLRYDYRDAVGLTTRPRSPVVRFNAHAASLIGSAYIDILSMLMDDQGKVPVFTPDGKLITYDTNHLTPAGARWLGQRLLNTPPLADVLAPPPGDGATAASPTSPVAWQSPRS